MDELGYHFAGLHAIDSLDVARLAAIRKLAILTEKYGLSINPVLLTKVANIGQIVHALNHTGIHWLQLHRQWSTSDLITLRNELSMHQYLAKIIMLIDPAFIPSRYVINESLNLVDFVILDHQMGGTGHLLPPDGIRRAIELIAPSRVFLAGGLVADNVADAIHQYRPFAVDVQSGVMNVAGVQDPIKLAAFIRAVRSFPYEATRADGGTPNA